jgi:hypothetical protein
MLSKGSLSSLDENQRFIPGKFDNQKGRLEKIKIIKKVD